MKKKILALLLGAAVSMQSMSFTAITSAEAPPEEKQVTVSTYYDDYTEITLSEGETVQLVLLEQSDMPEIKYIYSLEQKTVVTNDLKLTGISAGDEDVSVFISYKGLPHQDVVHIRAHILEDDSISDEARRELGRVEKLDGYYRRRMELLGVLDENAPRLDMEKVQEIIDTSEDYFDIFSRLSEYHIIADRIPGSASTTSYSFWLDPKGNESVTWYAEREMITYSKTNDKGIVEEFQFLYPEKSEIYKDGTNINYEYIQYNQIKPEGNGTLNLKFIDSSTEEAFTETNGKFQLLSDDEVIKSWDVSEGSEITISNLSRESTYEIRYVDDYHGDFPYDQQYRYEIDHDKGKNYFSFGYDTEISYKVYLRKRYRGDPYLLGDVNGDNRFNIADVVTLQKWLLGKPDTVLMNWKAADLCTDGVLNVLDLCVMRKALFENNSSDF